MAEVYKAALARTFNLEKSIRIIYVRRLQSLMTYSRSPAIIDGGRVIPKHLLHSSDSCMWFEKSIFLSTYVLNSYGSTSLVLLNTKPPMIVFLTDRIYNVSAPSKDTITIRTST